MKKTILLLWLLASAAWASSQKIVVRSPNGKIVFTLFAKSKAYTVSYKGKQIIGESPLKLEFRNEAPFDKQFTMGKSLISDKVEKYELIVGKAKSVVHPFKEAIIPFTEKAGKKRKINVVVRTFDDGVAFRYEFPEQDGWEAYQLTEERSSFNLLHNPGVHGLFFANTFNSHEGFYSKLQYNEIPADSLMDMPALFIFPDSVYLSITEANLKNYAGMYLQKKGSMLECSLSPLPGQRDIKVKAKLPHKTPWRVMLISDRVGDLIESNMITSLNDPLAIDDVSWIKPGQTTFHWWNGDIAPDTSFEPGLNFNFNKYYIDFCAASGIDYHAVIGYGGRPWYKNDGAANYQPGPNTDVTQMVPGFSMKQVADYARSKGVGIHTWVHWQALYPKIDTAFALFEQWGINGMMVDFMDRDDQEMVNIQEEILRKAAKHKLYIQFHGAFKPTGLHRTYPNEFTREGTYNYEQNKWAGKSVNANHDLDISFTRLLAGATDYHLGGFRAVPESKFKPQFTRPLVTSTRAHMLAMYIVLESYLTSICDYPYAYNNQEGFDLLTTIPTTWDETKVLVARVDNYLIIARRKGNDWYIGGINNSQARTLNIPMQFLGEGVYDALIFTDAADAGNDPNHLNKDIKTVKPYDMITIPFAASGGTVIRLTKKPG